MDMTLERIEPLQTAKHHENYSRSLMDELKKVTESIVSSNRELKERLESIIPVWTEFIKAIRDIDVDKDASLIEEVIRQNKTLQDQNNDLVTSVQYLTEMVDKMSRSQGTFRSLPPKDITPRRYPKIKIVK